MQNKPTNSTQWWMESWRCLVTLLVVFIMFPSCLMATECHLNSQLENHLTQLVEDMKVMMNDYNTRLRRLESDVKPCGNTLPEAQPEQHLISVTHHLSSSGSYKVETWNEAKSLCAHYGLNMATVDQLADAQSKGYDQCACGWLADGSVMYPVTNPRKGCGGTKTGLIPCPTDPAKWGTDGWDVYCSKVKSPVEYHHSPTGSYKLATWSDALAECGKYGLVLAPPALLQQAWTAGYDQCSCGWLADGSVRYPVTKPRPGCGGTQSGLIQCSTNPADSSRQGWDVYCTKSKIPVEHHQSPLGAYKLATWDEAKAKCARHGLTMATATHLRDAWSAGYDKCACGWLADGTVRYPVTNPRRGCGGTRKGLIECSTNPDQSGYDGWDVYCFSGY